MSSLSMSILILAWCDPFPAGAAASRNPATPGGGAGSFSGTPSSERVANLPAVTQLIKPGRGI